MFNELMIEIENYYKIRGLQWPDKKDALLWLTTEVGETIDAVMRSETGWATPDRKVFAGVRNSHKNVSAPEELADCLLLVMVASKAMGVDIVEVLLQKMHRKLENLKF